ncbi:MAG: WD40/YVTN/BNR-like repeat-containing protein [Candidatus Limnocylindrales bacterium]
MPRRLLLLLGTKKGAFILDGDEARQEWRIRGPLVEGWPLNHVTGDPATGTIFAGGRSFWYGPAVWRSDDLGGTWTHSSEGLDYGDDGPKLKTVWHIKPVGDALYAGVDPAGLFRSDDGGKTWALVKGLTEHPSRESWQPGFGGLCLHSIVPHATDPQRMWIAISAVGTFATEDGGASWEPRNSGVRTDFLPGPPPETGQCVHKLVAAAGMPERLYQQNHCGTYRSDDAGRTWVTLDPGLPSTFGFPMVAHPTDPDTVFTIPLNGDDRGRYMPDGKAAVWRTQDAGATWHDLRAGLPQEDAYLGVLREAMARDELQPFGLYFGTSTGQLFASADEGENWREIAAFLPPIHSVETLIVEA